MPRAQHNIWATGLERRRLYSLWCSMHARCTNPARSDYARYGNELHAKATSPEDLVPATGSAAIARAQGEQE